MENCNRNILVVDDDWTIWSSYELILTPEKSDASSPLEQLRHVLSTTASKSKMDSEYDFKLSFASQGEEALALVQNSIDRDKPFSIAFIDVRMPPGWDGMETARRIRAVDPNLEIVIVTAYSDRSSAEITETVGSPHKLLFFRKPFDPDELKQLAISLTDKYHITLQEKNQRLKLEALLESSPTAIFAVDRDNRVLSWNRAAETITGYAADEVIDRPCDIHSITANSQSFQNCLQEAFEAPINDQQFEILCKDSTPKIISLNLTSIRGRTTRQNLVIGSFWDITTLKNSQMALEKANAELKKQMQEKDQLQKKQLKLERKFNQARKMEAIGLMAGGVAHDLNNILTSIVSYPDVLLRELEKGSKLYDGIKMIQNSGKRAATVVADLLTVARGVAVQKQPHHLNALIIDYLQSPEGSLLKEQFPELIITTTLDPANPSILCSPVHITKCLMNLLHNAAEAMTDTWQVEIGTRLITLDITRSEELDLRQGDYVLLTIRDSGTGISPEDQERIFEPFFSKKAMGRSGTGLGLTVVWNTVLDHHGNVRIKSDGNGTEFKIYLPVCTKQHVPLADSDKGLDIYGSGKILVVDDEEQQRVVLREMLSLLGYSVETVKSGEEAVAYLKTGEVDLILLDMLMGAGMDGLQTYTEICKSHPQQKAIILSGYSANSMVEKARKLGVEDFISKPFSIEKLGTTIKTLIAQ